MGKLRSSYTGGTSKELAHLRKVLKEKRSELGKKALGAEIGTSLYSDRSIRLTVYERMSLVKFRSIVAKILKAAGMSCESQTYRSRKEVYFRTIYQFRYVTLTNPVIE